MTTDEAKRVAEIMTQADSSCPTCAGRLMRALTVVAPEHKALIEKTYKDEFESSLFAEDK